ncbi:hypothetical protein Micbo1qcDRAFT_11400 [Microdochium bolleyi]|uniref:Uncharacterized protein n=1 Tax=Microdochium bolleyi TaxID=196109 RepID=A0A136IYC9_9PEZI|nr:hypothetical protein Micbo1qcDRAFT_11400 [Microdochium bolleyi]
MTSEAVSRGRAYRRGQPSCCPQTRGERGIATQWQVLEFIRRRSGFRERWHDFLFHHSQTNRGPTRRYAKVWGSGGVTEVDRARGCGINLASVPFRSCTECCELLSNSHIIWRDRGPQPHRTFVAARSLGTMTRSDRALRSISPAVIKLAL